MSLNIVSFSDKKNSFLEDENIGRSFLKEQYKNDVRIKVYENAIISIAARIARCEGGVSDSEVDAFKKHCLQNGLDDIGLTMQKVDSIDAFEVKYGKTMPWV